MQLEPLTSKNSIFVIAPYWLSGTWVFDDAHHGLVREPFVAGVPEILNDLVHDIENAKQGFRLFFSATPFPGVQAHYKKVKSDTGGTWYKAEDGREGWLCPALFKYLDPAPENLYVRAEEIHGELKHPLLNGSHKFN